MVVAVACTMGLAVIEGVGVWLAVGEGLAVAVWVGVIVEEGVAVTEGAIAGTAVVMTIVAVADGVWGTAVGVLVGKGLVAAANCLLTINPVASSSTPPINTSAYHHRHQPGAKEADICGGKGTVVGGGVGAS